MLGWLTMKLELPIPAINVICDALRCLQQQTAVALEQIVSQVNAQQEPETKKIAPPDERED